MKKINMLLAILGIALISANAFLLYSLNSNLDRMNSRLDQLEVQIARFKSSTNSQNNIQESAGTKEKEVFTPTELAEYLNIRMDKVYDIIDDQGIGLPYVCIDGEYRFSKEAIDGWLKTNRNILTGN